MNSLLAKLWFCTLKEPLLSLFLLICMLSLPDLLLKKVWIQKKINQIRQLYIIMFSRETHNLNGIQDKCSTKLPLIKCLFSSFFLTLSTLPCFSNANFPSEDSPMKHSVSIAITRREMSSLSTSPNTILINT